MGWVSNPHPWSEISCNDVMTWKRFPHYWPFVRGIQKLSLDSPHNGSDWSPVMKNFDVSFVVILGQLLNKQSSCQWFEMTEHSCDITVMMLSIRKSRHIWLFGLQTDNLWLFSNWFIVLWWLMPYGIMCLRYSLLSYTLSRYWLKHILVKIIHANSIDSRSALPCRILTSWIISMLRNNRKCKYIYRIFWKNSALQGNTFRPEVAAILQTLFSKAFLWYKIVFWF